jgi:hypothetical protein
MEKDILDNILINIPVESGENEVAILGDNLPNDTNNYDVIVFRKR